MTDLRPSLSFLSAILMTSACTSAPEYTKEEARALGGLTMSGDDICDLEGWYDDGTCDDFCVEVDPDCATCAAVPSCATSETGHWSESGCPADASCRAVTVCGSTIWCSDTGGADPACGSGETEHAREEDCPADSSCREVTDCGGTIWCSDTATCAGYPSCDSGETEHSRWEECPADGSCREVSECGATIWCSSSPEVTCAGRNPEGCLSSGCAPGFHCDTTMGSAPSACECSPESGSWACTPDVSGGVCVEDE